MNKSYFYEEFLDKLIQERDFYKQSYVGNLKITIKINPTKSGLSYASFEDIVVDKLLTKCKEHKADLLEVSPKLYDIISTSDLGKTCFIKDLDNLGIDYIEFGIEDYYKVLLVKNDNLRRRYFLLGKYLKNNPSCCLGYLKGKINIPRSL